MPTLTQAADGRGDGTAAPTKRVRWIYDLAHENEVTDKHNVLGNERVEKS